jgi:microcystin-dependent protein
MDPILASIMIFGGNFAPKGWAFCNGQILSINQNQALFSLLGTTYGGNGTTNFALPDLRGRVPMHMGQGPGLSNYVLGQSAGTETNTILVSNMPAHNHTLNAVTNAGDTSVPTGAFLGNTGALDKEYKSTGTTTPMNAGTIGNTGSSIPLNNIQPYLTFSFCIALVGIFPSQN